MTLLLYNFKKVNLHAVSNLASCITRTIHRNLNTSYLRNCTSFDFRYPASVKTWPFLQLCIKDINMSFKCTFAPALENPSLDKMDHVTQMIVAQRNSYELLNLLSQFDQSLLNAEHAWLFTAKLLRLYYQDLLASLSWLQTNLYVAHIQLHLHNAVQSFALPLLNHKNHSIFHDLLAAKYATFTNQQLADCFLSSLFMGFTFEDPLMQKFLYTIHVRLTDFDSLSLRTVSYLLKALPGYDFVAVRELTKRFEALLDQKTPADTSGEEVAALAAIYLNSQKFFTVELVQKFMEWFIVSIRHNRILENPNYVSTFVRLAQKFTLNHYLPKHVAFEIISSVVTACHQLMEGMDDGNIADICYSLKLCRSYDSDLAKLFEMRANSLLSDESRLCVVTNLMYALTCHSSKEIIHKFEGVLHSKLIHEKDIDIIVLSNIADCLIDLPYVNYDLLQVFQQHVVAQADNIITYISRYNKIVKLLIRYRFTNLKLEMQFRNTLLEQLEHQHGLHLHSVSSLAIFILPFSYKALPETFFRKLLLAIPRWKEAELYRLALGINSMQQPVAGLLRFQVSQILSILYTSIIDCLGSVEAIDFLYQLTQGLVVRHSNHDPVLTDRLMAMYPRFTKNLNDVTIAKVVQTFRKITYYLPEVYEDMMQFVIKTSEGSNGESKFLDVLFACAKVGYQPQHREKLLNVSMAIYHRLCEHGNLKASLQLLNHLCLIQLYPEQEIVQLFTLEGIEALDRYIEENPQYKNVIENSLMELNRSIVLECPQLHVPWFHQQYCLDHIEKAEEKLDSGVNRLKQDVYLALCEALGGQMFIKSGSYSAYFHTIDFECAFDCFNQAPVFFTKLNNFVNGDNEFKQLQKFAVSILLENSYCYNSKRLSGQEQQKKRQLELMGYKYIEVPYFEWYSMGMTDWNSKVQYLHSKFVI